MALIAKRKRPAQEIEVSLRAELAELGSIINLTHCQIELRSYEPVEGLARLRVDGSCPDCDVSPATFIAGIEARLKLRVPELRAIAIEPRE